jgi:predicted NAD/FAD-binding protein
MSGDPTARAVRISSGFHNAQGPMPRYHAPLDIAVIGTGIAGMSAAWLLSGSHRVTVYEQADRLGGHSNTVDVPGPGGPVAVDTGFIVYNEHTYPNLTALFRHLDVPTVESDMSFAVSLRDGALEYAGTDLRGLFAQRRNLLRPRFWTMLRDLLRFYREAPRDIATLDDPALSLRAYLDARGYSRAFVEDHLLPMAAAIWSTPSAAVGDQPAASFIRFCANHGLLQVRDRPAWRTVAGGSRRYVEKLTALYAKQVRLGCGVHNVRRLPDRVMVSDCLGGMTRFDHVVIATHPDQAFSMLSDWSAAEAALLGAFRYGENTAVLHTDPSLMPRRRKVWSSWNYLGDATEGPAVTYWMNRLQGLQTSPPLFVSLNAPRPPDPARVLRTEIYEHPLMDSVAAAAQRGLWDLQGVRRTWFCGAWFGAGFHEDGLQSGLAVAEQLGGVRRPWIVPNESGRIHLGTATPAATVYAA